jgi:hypothetical protein
MPTFRAGSGQRLNQPQKAPFQSPPRHIASNDTLSWIACKSSVIRFA